MTEGNSAKRRKAGLGSAFWRLFASSSASNLSDGIALSAMPLLAAALTRDPVLVSLVSSLAFLPWLLFAIPAGALVDRIDRRRAMALANGSRALLLTVLAILIVTGTASMPALYVIAFLLGVAETVYDNAARAMLPRVVRRDQLERGNSLLSTFESVGNLFLGAPIGALLFALAAFAPFVAALVAYVLAAVLIVTVAGNFKVERAENTTLVADIREGLGWLFAHRILRSVLVVTALGGFAFAMTNGIAVLFALETLGLTEVGFGIVLSVTGVAAIIGALISPLATKAFGRTNAMGLLSTLAGVSLLVAGLAPIPAVAVPAVAMSALTVSAFNVQIMSVRQVLIPDALFGRVQGAYRTVLWGGIPIGTVLGGALAAWLGLANVYLVAGALAIVSGVATWLVLGRHRAEIAAAFDSDADADSDASGGA